MTDFTGAIEIADAVLFEGYLLFPYTASATKNRMRWQFGVLVPSDYEGRGTGESSRLQAELCLRVDEPAARVALKVRFLQIQARIVEAYDEGRAEFVRVDGMSVDGKDYLTWDEAIPREVDCGVVPDSSTVTTIDVPGTESSAELRDGAGVLRGRIVRRQWPLRGAIAAAFESYGAYGKICVRVLNDSLVLEGSERSSALRTSFLSTHVLLGVEGGVFISHLDPPDDAAATVASCVQTGVFPVLAGADAGERRASAIALASPIILYDFPQISPQSRGNLFDGTEIDELLNLSVLSMSDQERREARATDPAARAIVDRAESLGKSDFDDMHGIWRDETAEAGNERVKIGDVTIGKGSRVRLRPKRQADVWDFFVDGKEAHVQGVYRDMEDRVHVAVTVDDDPASEFHEWYGRALFYGCDEVEPLEAIGR